MKAAVLVREQDRQLETMVKGFHAVLQISWHPQGWRSGSPCCNHGLPTGMASQKPGRSKEGHQEPLFSLGLSPSLGSMSRWGSALHFSCLCPRQRTQEPKRKSTTTKIHILPPHSFLAIDNLHSSKGSLGAPTSLSQEGPPHPTFAWPTEATSPCLS